MKTPDIASTAEGRLVLKIDKEGLARSVVLAAAFDYIDRAWIFVRSEQDAFVLSMTPRARDASETELRELAEKVTESLYDHHLRQQLHHNNAELLEVIRNRAFGGADALGGGEEAGRHDEDLDEIDDLEDLEDLDFLDDPLGIAVPWEERGDEGEDTEDDKKGGSTS